MSSPSPMDTNGVDTDAQIREMMGFASFGMQKPASSTMSSSTPSTQNSIIEKPKFGDNTSNLPAKPVFAPASNAATVLTPENAMPLSQTVIASSNNPSPIVYTDPVTGISITRQDLFAYGQGKRVNEQGDVMFFRPSFLDEDPWKSLKNKR